MSEEAQQDKKIYEYHYVQFSASLREKEIIKQSAERENFKTISDFIRRIVFSHIRRQENPELFLPNGSESPNILLLEKLVKSVQKLHETQETIMQKEELITKLQEGFDEIKYMLEMNTLTEERKKVIDLLEKHSSLSFKQLRQMTGLPEGIITQIIWNPELFKKTQRGRFALI